MAMDVKSIVLTQEEEYALIDLNRGLPIRDELGLALYASGLCEQKTALEEDGSVSRIGWNITRDGQRWLYFQHCEQEIKRTETVRYWITTGLAIIAIVISVIALIVSLHPAGS